MARTNPPTSVDAYGSVKEERLIEKHHVTIIAALRKLQLAMGEEIAAETGLDKWQIMRRMSELELVEQVFKTGIKRKTSSGRDAFCYTLTDKATASPERKKRQPPMQKNALVQQTLNIFG